MCHGRRATLLAQPEHADFIKLIGAQDLQDIINAFGGKMPQTWGVPVEEIQRGIKNGVRKVNIDTDSRMAMTGQVRKVLAENPGEFDPRKYLKPAMDATLMMRPLRRAIMEFLAMRWLSKK